LLSTYIFVLSTLRPCCSRPLAGAARPPQDYGYTGQEMDGVGSTYHDARSLLNLFGRWRSTDPLLRMVSGAGHDASRLTLAYAYATNNPTNRTDAEGLDDSPPDFEWTLDEEEGTASLSLGDDSVTVSTGTVSVSLGRTKVKLNDAGLESASYGPIRTVTGKSKGIGVVDFLHDSLLRLKGVVFKTKVGPASAAVTVDSSGIEGELAVGDEAKGSVGLDWTNAAGWRKGSGTFEVPAEGSIGEQRWSGGFFARFRGLTKKDSTAPTDSMKEHNETIEKETEKFLEAVK